MLKEGTKAPLFTLPGASGKMVSLSDFAGKNRRAVLLLKGRHRGLHTPGAGV